MPDLNWRVNYHLWAAGGGVVPTSRWLHAESAEDAIAKVTAFHRAERRCSTAYMNNAVASPVTDANRYVRASR